MSSVGSCGSRCPRRSTLSSAVAAAVVGEENRSRSTFARAATSAHCSGLKRLAAAAHSEVAASAMRTADGADLWPPSCIASIMGAAAAVNHTLHRERLISVRVELL
jgi:hypothetical protein